MEMTAERHQAAAWFRELRDRIVAAFEALDGADRPAAEDDEDDVDPPPRLGGWDPLAND